MCITYRGVTRGGAIMTLVCGSVSSLRLCGLVYWLGTLGLGIQRLTASLAQIKLP